MKILIVTNMYPSRKKRFYGSFVKDQVEELTGLGHDVRVVADKGIENTLIKYTQLYLMTFIHWVLFRPQIIHIHYVYPTGLFPIILGKVVGVPAIITSHRGDVFDMPLRNNINLMLTRFCINHSSGIVAVSSAIKNQILSTLKCHPPEITEIDMGFRIDQDFNAIKQYSPKCRLVFVGISFERKGGYVLLSAIRKAKSVCGSTFIVRFIGEFPQKAEALVKEYQIEDVVEIIGFLEKKMVLQCVSECDVFILPSYSEGMPVAMLEAMALGLAVVATAVGDISKAINERNGILVPVGDNDALCQAIVDLVNNNKLVIDMAQSAKITSQQYTSKEKALSLLSFYNRCVTHGQY